MSSNTTVFVLEDNESQRIALEAALRARGFLVISAGDIEGARRAIETYGESIDLAILDMWLDDPAGLHVTGADIGAELRELRRQSPPEFIVYSGRPDVDAYRRAFKLGASAFIEKTQDIDIPGLVRHIKVIALKHALSVERPGAADQIKRIAELSRSPHEAIVMFCRLVLAPALRNTIRAPFVLLISDRAGSYALAEDCGLRLGRASTYQTIQATVFSQGDRTQPVIVNEEHFGVGDLTAEEKGVLSGASFVSLLSGDDVRISIGVMQQNRQRNPLADDARELAELLARYFRSAVLEHSLRITTLVAELGARRRAELEATSRLCLHIGQRQARLLGGLITGDAALANPELHQLLELSQELEGVGSLLSTIAGAAESVDVRPSVQIDILAAPLVQAAWDHLGEYSKSRDARLTIEGDCTVTGQPGELFVAIVRTLRWLHSRAIELQSPGGKSIIVRCQQTSESGEIAFEDESARLPSATRSSLFEPFAVAGLEAASESGEGLDLFVARTIVECANSGALEDRSHELLSPAGHRLVMRFPLRSPSPESVH